MNLTQSQHKNNRRNVCSWRPLILSCDVSTATIHDYEESIKTLECVQRIQIRRECIRASKFGFADYFD